jgi:hypothetical protein
VFNFSTTPVVVDRLDQEGTPVGPDSSDTAIVESSYSCDAICSSWYDGMCALRTGCWGRFMVGFFVTVGVLFVLTVAWRMRHSLAALCSSGPRSNEQSHRGKRDRYTRRSSADFRGQRRSTVSDYRRGSEMQSRFGHKPAASHARHGIPSKHRSSSIMRTLRHHRKYSPRKAEGRSPQYLPWKGANASRQASPQLRYSSRSPSPASMPRSPSPIVLTMHP